MGLKLATFLELNLFTCSTSTAEHARLGLDRRRPLVEERNTGTNAFERYNLGS